MANVENRQIKIIVIDASFAKHPDIVEAFNKIPKIEFIADPRSILLPEIANKIEEDFAQVISPPADGTSL